MKTKTYKCACGCGRTIERVRVDNRGHWSDAKYATQQCRDRERKNKAQKSLRRHEGSSYYDEAHKWPQTIDHWLYHHPATHGDGTRDYALDPTRN